MCVCVCVCVCGLFYIQVYSALRIINVLIIFRFVQKQRCNLRKFSQNDHNSYVRVLFQSFKVRRKFE